MKQFKKPFAIIMIMTLAIACTRNSNSEVQYTGALRTIMSGNLSATSSLDTLSQKKNLYALGAEESLKGEIQVFNGESFISRKNGKNVSVSNSFKVQAALLVYAEIDAWKTFHIPTSISSKNDLEQFVFETAKKEGLDTEKPFPFLIEGEIASLDWHVIDWPKNDKVHNHQKHKEAGVNGKLNNTLIDILGFYSNKHKAIFTHHTTNMHMHFKTNDNTIAGHVDDLIMDKKVILKLPK